MPDSAVPWGVVTTAATATVFIVMLGLGLTTGVSDIRPALAMRSLLVRALLSATVIVPALAVVVTRAMGLEWHAQVGIVLMAIAPAAPLALRRTVDAGSLRGFATTLQLTIALLAVLSMPASIVLLNPLYAGHAVISPTAIARQVFVLQVFPLALGMLARWAAPSWTARVDTALSRLGRLLLAAFLLLAVVAIWRQVLDAAPTTIAAIVVVTVLALVTGHLAGGPDDNTRTAVAIACGARNAGLALVVVAANAPQPGVISTVLAHLVWSALVVTVYILWRQRISVGRQGSSTLNGRPE